MSVLLQLTSSGISCIILISNTNINMDQTLLQFTYLDCKLLIVNGRLFPVRAHAGP